MMTSPPLPPSPPEGPPRGTNFSRRKARHPLPPSPAFTRIVASSMNTAISSWRKVLECRVYREPVGRTRLDLLPQRALQARYRPLVAKLGMHGFCEHEGLLQVLASLILAFQLEKKKAKPRLGLN